MIYTIIVVFLFLIFIGWREYLFSKQIKNLLLINKAKDSEEYAHYRSVDEPIKEEPVTETEIDLEDTTPEQWANLNK